MYRAVFLTVLFFIFSVNAVDVEKKDSSIGILSSLEEKLESKLGEYSTYLTQWLAKFNDKHLGGNSEIGRFMHYEEMKPKVELVGTQGRNMKKMGMAMIPLIFHVGATSTWMLLTSLLAAKSVAIGMLLLIFKIAVSSAKVASFFTLLKAKHFQSHHEWTPHYEHHHGHKRSLEYLEHPTYLEHPGHEESYIPHSAADWSASDPQYKTLASYKQATDPYTEFAAETKQTTKVEKNYG